MRMKMSSPETSISICRTLLIWIERVPASPLKLTWLIEPVIAWVNGRLPF
jgi:hypothetical protein